MSHLVRHPAYAGILVSMVGLALTLGNKLSVVLVITGYFLAHVPPVKAGSNSGASLGEQYREFERTRKRLIPGVW